MLASSPSFHHPFLGPRVADDDPRHLPTVGEILRRVVPQAIEASVVPAIIVLLVANVASPMMAIGAALAYVLVLAMWRIATRRSVTGLSILAITRMSLRSLIAIAAGSTFVYFAQASLGGYVLALAFLASVAIGRPLARRFAGDFTDLPTRVLDHHRVGRALRRISVLWGLVGLAHATVGLWLLVNLSTNAYVVVNTLLSVAVPAALIALSVVWFRRTVALVP